jgi:calreticulin
MAFRLTLLLLAAVCLTAHASVLYKETFDNGASKWVKSAAKSDFGDMKVTNGKFKGDAGLQTAQDARFYAYSTSADAAFDNEGKTLVFSFSVTHEQNIDCGGGYLKLLPKVDGKEFSGDSKYYIMFGPDICGATKKVHLIFHYKGKNLEWKKQPRAESDELTHFYTLILKPDNTYEVLIDNEKKESGKLDEDWEFLAPKTIADPNEKKPSDWVDEAEIVDPEDKKPSDWDTEPETVKDPEASKPDDWDEEEDGEWEAPTIPNPKYKGEWRARMIPNPKYKGEWKAKEIANPDYVEDDKLYHFADSQSIGIDLWQVKSGSIFDNILISTDPADAESLFKDYKSKLEAEKKKKDAAQDAARKEEEEKRKADEAKDEDEEEEDEKDEL